MTEQQIAEATPQKGVANAVNVPAAPPEPSRSRRLLPWIIVLGLVVAVLVVWRGFFASSGVPDSIVTVSGRIEGDDSAVAPKTAGRILEVRVREGDSVKAGDTIAILDDAQLRAREDAARAALTAAQAGAKAAQDQIAVLQQQLDQNRLLEGQAKLDADGRVRQAEADVAAAQSDLAQQQAAYSLALFDKDAYTKLAASGAVSERQGKQAVATADQDAAAVAAAQRRLTATQGALTTAQANMANEGIRQSQTLGVQKQITQQQAQIASANAGAEQARAELASAQADRQDLTVTAPFNGTVLDPRRRTRRGRTSRDRHHHAPGPYEGVSAWLRSGRRDRQGRSEPTGAHLSGLKSQAARQRIRLAHRSRGHLHTGEYLLS